MGLRLPYGVGQAAAALLLATLPVSRPAAEELGPFDYYGWEDWLQPEPPLPEGIIGTIRPQSDAPAVRRVNTMRDVFKALEACWRPPSADSFSGQELTVRISFKRSGEVLGRPLVTYYKAGPHGNQREPFSRSIHEAFERCTPLPFTESFGAAIAGRIFAFRFIDARPM